MKKIIFTFAIALNANLIFAQLTWIFTHIFDSLLFQIGKSDATTGILYDRVVPFAYLMKFTFNSTSQKLVMRIICIKNNA